MKITWGQCQRVPMENGGLVPKIKFCVQSFLCRSVSKSPKASNSCAKKETGKFEGKILFEKQEKAHNFFFLSKLTTYGLSKP